MPPDGGLTYIDFIAYQGNPVGSVTGHENLTSWWDGTNCKEVTLPQVCSEYPPNNFYLAGWVSNRVSNFQLLWGITKKKVIWLYQLS